AAPRATAGGAADIALLMSAASRPRAPLPVWLQATPATTSAAPERMNAMLVIRAMIALLSCRLMHEQGRRPGRSSAGRGGRAGFSASFARLAREYEPAVADADRPSAPVIDDQ